MARGVGSWRGSRVSSGWQEPRPVPCPSRWRPALLSPPSRLVRLGVRRKLRGEASAGSRNVASREPGVQSAVAPSGGSCPRASRGSTRRRPLGAGVASGAWLHPELREPRCPVWRMGWPGATGSHGGAGLLLAGGGGGRAGPGTAGQEPRAVSAVCGSGPLCPLTLRLQGMRPSRRHTGVQRSPSAGGWQRR